MRPKVIFSCCSHPTVVMEINDHQNPSPTPLLKEAGNSSGFCFMSCLKILREKSFKKLFILLINYRIWSARGLTMSFQRIVEYEKRHMISTEEKKENHAYFHKAYGLNEGQFREREVKRFYIKKKWIKQHCHYFTDLRLYGEWAHACSMLIWYKAACLQRGKYWWNFFLA